MDTLHFEASDIFHVTPEALWPLISDTARMNRAIGSPPVVHTIVPLDGGGSRIEGEIRLLGLPLARYAEHPFRWEAPHGFVVVRELPAGPLLRIRAGTRLEPVEGGTEVTVYGDFVPRTALGALVARLVGPRSVWGTIRQCRTFERYLLGETDQPYPGLAPLPRLWRPGWLPRLSLPSGWPVAPSDAWMIERLVAGGVSQEAVELLRQHLAEAPDEDVTRMGPFELADGWGLDRRETLGLFLQATAAGLLVMSWDVLCPNCRVSKARAESLRDLVGRAHCETCNVSFDAAFDRSVEVRFSVAPRLRTVSTAEYCLGGPMNSPHVVAQTVVAPGGTERLHCQLEPGPYRLRPQGSPGRLMISAGVTPSLAPAPVRGRGEPHLEVTVGPERVEPAVADVAAGSLVLALTNDTDREQVVLVEGSLWPDTVVTAATVCTAPEFRALFPSETLAPGVRLGIESLAFLVVAAGEGMSASAVGAVAGSGRTGGTGAVGGAGAAGESGAMHRAPTGSAKVGAQCIAPPVIAPGPQASQAIAEHHGALVRTDGGTLLAAFASAADALAAGLSIQRQDDAGTRVGVHQGACVVANVDGRLDYVGRTVDVAAGLARVSRAGEIVASLEVCRSAEAAGLLQDAGIEDVLLRLPESDEPVPACRIVSQAGAAAEPARHPLALSTNGLISPLLRDWMARRQGPLRFDYHPGSYAGERIDAIATAYADALARITAFLGRGTATLPPLRIRLLDVPLEEDDPLHPTMGRRAARTSAAPTSLDPHGPNPLPGGERAVRTGLETSVLVTSESPGPPPEVVLTPLVLEALFGKAHSLGHFWTDGLAGYLAAQAGSAEHAEAAHRTLKLHEEGQLPALADLVQQSAERSSPVAALVATAFTSHLIQWRGTGRFCRLLRASRAGRSDAFRRLYGQPLPAVEGNWLHALEAAEQGSRRAALRSLVDLAPYFRAYWRHLSAILALILLGLLFDLFTPLALSFLIDNVLNRAPLGSWVPTVGVGGTRIAPEEQIPTLLKLLAAMVGMLVANAFSRFQQTKLLALIGEGVTLDLRRRFFGHLQRLPVGFHARTSATDLSQRFFTDIGQVPAALSTGLSLVINGTAMVMFGSTLLSLNVWLGLAAIAGLPAFALAARQGRIAMRQATRERGRRMSEIQQSLFECLSGQRFLRIWNAVPFVDGRFGERLEIHRELNIRMAMLGQALSRTSITITNVAQLTVLIGGGLLVILGGGSTLSAGGLMAAYLMLMRLYTPAGSFAGAIQSLEQAADALVRLQKVLGQVAETEPDEAASLGGLERSLVLDNLALVQPNGKAQLRGISVEIPAGSKVAFVGATGSGTTGLLTLLPRLEEPTSGQILWDGLDIRESTRAALRSEMTVLLQDNFVLHATLYDNVRLGRPAATEAEVLAATRASGLHDLVMSLPSGYDTVVGDRDPLLTTAMRQRLGVAQALLHGGSVVVMDDATAALEPTAQRDLEAALRGPDHARTLIRVTQRLSTIADADQIFVLDEGRIVQQGTHDDLIEQDGLYAQLLSDEMGEASLSGAHRAIRRLRQLTPFAELPSEVLEELSRQALFMAREPGQEIVRQGSSGDELYIVGRGELEVLVEDAHGQVQQINVLGEGDYFGEISFLRRAPRTATIRARTPTELYILRRLDFDQLLARLNVGVLSQIEATAQARLEDTSAKLAQLSA